GLEGPEDAFALWVEVAGGGGKGGRRERGVLQHAVSVIGSGLDLARWDGGSRDDQQRQAVLERLRVQLTSRQPPERRIPRQFRDSNEWQAGDLVAYRLISGRFVILRVIGHQTDKGGTAPVCELLDWVCEELPNELPLRFLGIR